MKILMISSYLPFPLHSGGHVRLYNLIKELSVKHEITLVCEKRPQQTHTDVLEVEKICKKVITVNRKKQWSIENVLRAASTNHSFLVTGHTHHEMQKKIKEVLLEKTFDVIHVETFYVIQNVPVVPLPLVLVDHNIEYYVYKKFRNRVSLPLRPILDIDIAKMKKEEQACWKQATQVVAVSEADKKVMEKIGLQPALVPNGVNIEQFSFKEKSFDKLRTKRILFIGDFKWLQNRDSVEFIIKEIWPLMNQESRIKNQEVDIKLWIVGRTIPESVRHLTSDPSVLFDEESSTKSTPQIFQEADVLLAPLRVGGGTSYKILESMSSGTPVVTMPMSASAISAIDEKDIMVGRVAQELADKTLELLENKNLYAKIAKNGRKLIEENFSWKQIARELEAVYDSVTRNSIT